MTRAAANLIGGAAILGLSIISLLPESLLLLVARGWGRIGPLLQPARARIGRANLARVYTYRDGVTPTDSALGAHVRALFEHHLRFYIETARAPRHARSIVATRVDLEDETFVKAAFAGSPRRAAIFLAAHFGAVELPGSILADRSGQRPLALPARPRPDVALDNHPAPVSPAGQPHPGRTQERQRNRPPGENQLRGRTAAVEPQVEPVLVEPEPDVRHDRWRALPVPDGQTYAWDSDSTYVQLPPFFSSITPEPALRNSRSRGALRPSSMATTSAGSSSRMATRMMLISG